MTAPTCSTSLPDFTRCPNPVVATITRKGSTFHACEACLPEWENDPKNTVTRLDGEPALSVCARRRPLCIGWQRLRLVDGNWGCFPKSTLRTCKVGKARWGRCLGQTPGVAATLLRGYHEAVHALARVVDERDAALDHVATLTRALNEARVHEQEATAALVRLEDAVRSLRGSPSFEALGELFALVPERTP